MPSAISAPAAKAKTVVFFDIDGTIIDNESQIIPDSAIEAVKKLRENGHTPVVNTGRPYAQIDPRVRAMDFAAWICGCGLETKLNGQWLSRRTPSAELCAYVVRQARRYDLRPMYESEDGSIVYDPQLLGHPRQALEMTQMLGKGFPVCSIEAHPTFQKFVSWDGDPKGTPLFHRAMEPYFEIITRGSGGFSEYVLKGNSKARGMEELLEYLGISRENTLAIGDSTNDLPMFSAAKHTACLGGGMKELKQVAEFVTAPVLEDGIAKALQHFGLI